MVSSAEISFRNRVADLLTQQQQHNAKLDVLTGHAVKTNERLESIDGKLDRIIELLALLVDKP